MADKDLWVTFEKTGSVVDYLNYTAVSRNEMMPEDIK